MGWQADETVTFSVLKPVHLLPATESRCGLVTVVDIGLEIAEPTAVARLERADVARLWPVPGPTDDKYSRGVLGVVAGSEDYPGAAVLTVTAATVRPVQLRYPGLPEVAVLDADVAGVAGWFTDAHGAADWRRAVSRLLAADIQDELARRPAQGPDS